mgnify:CR=1 FL=1
MNLTGQNVAVLGAGRSGAAAARLALRLGASVTVYDMAGRDAFGQVPAEADRCPDATPGSGRDCKADLVVISPGIETAGKFATAFVREGREMIGEIELASRLYKGKVIGITGTNGKTTTTELIQRILSAGGMRCAACGNYGPPFADVLLEEDPPESVALELSSFQLETITGFRPDVAVWLNFSPDHMDRYAEVDDYRRAKLRIFECQRPGDAAVVRFGEDLGTLSAEVTTFSATEDGADYSLAGTRILHRGEPVMDLAETKLRGVHNAENAMAAMAATAILGVPATAAHEAFRNYAPPLHRCELVRTLDGVEYINDSKATNLHALESALRSQDRPTVLVAGGKDKGLDYAGLLPLLGQRVEAVVLIGEIREALAQQFSAVVETRVSDSLEGAVGLARSLAPRGGTVLFSPGTSSFDMFAGYEARGDVFRTAVKSLK